MITKEVREWLNKVERRQYSYRDAMEEFIKISAFLTKEEINMLKRKIENALN